MLTRGRRKKLTGGFTNIVDGTKLRQNVMAFYDAL
jgi:hypothetical protein